MRRGINIRKKNRTVLNESNKKSLKTLTYLFLILVICIAIYIFFIQNIFIKQNLENDSLYFSTLNEDMPFSIKKILLFNSATAEAKNTNQSLSLNISQYSDIAIYLSTTLNSNISISSLYIDNINISTPNIGTPYLYSKNLMDFGKCSFLEDNIINNNFNFNIVNPQDNIEHNNYEIYSNGTSPICFGFYNKNIKTDFFPTNSKILYNGTLLKEAIIPISNLTCNISFILNIITNSNAHYICNVNFDILLKDEKNSIYSTGYITREINNSQTNNFIRIK